MTTPTRAAIRPRSRLGRTVTGDSSMTGLASRRSATTVARASASASSEAAMSNRNALPGPHPGDAVEAERGQGPFDGGPLRDRRCPSRSRTSTRTENCRAAATVGTVPVGQASARRPARRRRHSGCEVAGHDLGGQGRGRGCLSHGWPSSQSRNGCLSNEGGLVPGRAVVGRPEPRGVRSQHLVADGQPPVDEAELELGVADDDPLLLGPGRGPASRRPGTARRRPPPPPRPPGRWPRPCRC